MRELLTSCFSRPTTHQVWMRVGPKSILAATLIAALAALLVAGCSSSSTASPSPSASKSSSSAASSAASPSAKPAESAPAKPKQVTKIRVADRPFVSFLPFKIAQDDGFFKEEGLEVTFTMFATGAQVAAAMTADEIDVGASTDEGALNLIARGADMKVIYPHAIVTKNNKASAVVVRKDLYDAGVTKPVDLKGRSIAWIAGWSTLPYALQKSMEAAGVDTYRELKKETIRESAAVISALENGSIDSAMQNEPALTITTSRGIGVPILYINQPEGIPSGTITLKGSFLKQNREAVLGFLRAFIKGMRVYTDAMTDLDLKRKLADRYAKDYNLTPDDMVKQAWNELGVDGNFNKQAVQEWIDWVVANGGVQGKVTMEQWYDPSFTEELKKLGFIK